MDVFRELFCSTSSGVVVMRSQMLFEAGRPVATLRSALELLKINTQLYPKAFNTFDSLVEAYMENGDNSNTSGVIQFNLNLSDGQDNDSHLFSIMVSPINDRPQFISLPLDPLSMAEGGDFQTSFGISDIDSTISCTSNEIWN